MRIVVDTNVIVSALVFGGLPRQVLDLAGAGMCSVYFSPSIRAEVERILAEKFGWSAEEVQTRTRTLWGFANQVDPKLALEVIVDDPDDDRVLECAVAADANAIVSGDRHLLRLSSFRSIPVMSPRQFLESKAGKTAP